MEQRRDRLVKLYQWGDMSEEAYRNEGQQIEAQLAAPPAATGAAVAVLRQAAACLRDLAALWRDATSAERNTLPRLVAEPVEIEAGRLSGIVLNDEAGPLVEAGCQLDASGDGSDGVPIGVVDIFASRWNLVPDRRCPVPSVVSPTIGRASKRRYGMSRQAIAEEHLPAIIARAEHEGIRRIARDLGVSHEAVRNAIRTAGRSDLLTDPTRRRRLATAVPAPPAPAPKIPAERHDEVRRLCERSTQAEVAALFGVSQNTIWRIVHDRRH